MTKAIFPVTGPLFLAENSHNSFREVMKVIKLNLDELPTYGFSPKDIDPDSWYFRSAHKPFHPMSARGAYGGHVFAQSGWAAAQTVPPKFVLNSNHGQFLAPGRSKVPFLYRISVNRDGNSYCQRQILVYQQVESRDKDGLPLEGNDEGEVELVFTANASFKTPERYPPLLEHQRNLDLTEFGLTNGSQAAEVERLAPVAPDIDLDSWIELISSDTTNEKFRQIHPVEMRLMPLRERNANEKDKNKRRTIYFLRFVDDIGEYDPNLVVTALMWASDRNSMFSVFNMLDNYKDVTIRQTTSLDHSFVMHDLHPTLTTKDYATMEVYSDRTTDGRALYQGRIYDRDGILITSFMQDGVLRMGPKPKM